MKKLETVLKVNALFSITSGLIGAIFSKQLAQFLSVENHFILLFIGCGLVLFGSDVMYVAFKKSTVKIRVNVIILADLGWVLGSVILLFLRPVEFSNSAVILIATISSIVLTLGLLQQKYKA